MALLLAWPPGSVAGELRRPVPRPAPIVSAVPLRVGEVFSMRPAEGAVSLVSAIALTSTHPDFGGFSALLVEGDRLLAVSDHGALWQATLARGPEARLGNVEGWEMVWPGLPQGRPQVLDIEAIARERDGTIVLSLEQRRSLLELGAIDLAPRRERTLPAAIRSAERNGGVEAMAALPDGGLFLILEAADATGDHRAARLAADGTVQRLVYPSLPGFSPTAADLLDGELYILERSASLAGGLRAVVRSIPLSALQDGRVPETLSTRLQAQIDPVLIGANFEGLSAIPGPNGAVDLYLISDDNFTRLLPTVLVQLRLASTPLSQ